VRIQPFSRWVLCATFCSAGSCCRKSGLWHVSFNPNPVASEELYISVKTALEPECQSLCKQGIE
jgi:hypothetical protein